jgi:hypothetical protein
MAEIRTPHFLNPLPPSQAQNGKPLIPILRLRSHPSKCRDEKRVDDRHATATTSSSARAIRDELGKVAAAWAKMQKTRARDAVYDFLQAVYALVHDNWERRGRADRKARRALRAHGLKAPKYPEPYAAVIACTSNADLKARSKWSRAIRYFDSGPPKHESLKHFVKSKGGINRCAAPFARRLGRRSGIQKRESPD